MYILVTQAVQRSSQLAKGPTIGGNKDNSLDEHIVVEVVADSQGELYANDGKVAMSKGTTITKTTSFDDDRQIDEVIKEAKLSQRKNKEGMGIKLNNTELSREGELGPCNINIAADISHQSSPPSFGPQSSLFPN